MLSDHNARLAAARHLTKSRDRREAGRFLAEGAPAVRSALTRPELLVELYATEAAAERHADLLDQARASDIDASIISERAARSLSETVTPPGLVAVCRLPMPTLAETLAGSPRLLVGLAEPNDPGNVGTIIRTADAAGADAVLIDGGVDPFNGKAVRSSAGSIFHLPVIATELTAIRAQAAATDLDLQVLATTGRADRDLDELIDGGALTRPTLWLFGTEAHGLPDSALDAADETVRIPIYGGAESLNLSAAVAVCLYASARAQRHATHSATHSDLDEPS